MRCLRRKFRWKTYAAVSSLLHDISVTIDIYMYICPYVTAFGKPAGHSLSCSIQGFWSVCKSRGRNSSSRSSSSSSSSSSSRRKFRSETSDNMDS